MKKKATNRPPLTLVEPASTDRQPASTDRQPASTDRQPASTDRQPASTDRERELTSNSEGSRLWRKVLRERSLNASQRELLKQACTALNDADALRRRIAAEGAVLYADDGVPLRSHPAIRVELALRRFAAKTLADLNRVEKQPRPVGRPPSAACGVTPEQLGDRDDFDD
jgi:hypothetical protein